jgi:hypothetical protein
LKAIALSPASLNYSTLDIRHFPRYPTPAVAASQQIVEKSRRATHAVFAKNNLPVYRQD